MWWKSMRKGEHSSKPPYICHFCTNDDRWLRQRTVWFCGLKMVIHEFTNVHIFFSDPILYKTTTLIKNLQRSGFMFYNSCNRCNRLFLIWPDFLIVFGSVNNFHILRKNAICKWPLIRNNWLQIYKFRKTNILYKYIY